MNEQNCISTWKGSKVPQMLGFGVSQSIQATRPKYLLPQREWGVAMKSMVIKMRCYLSMFTVFFPLSIFL